MTQLKEINLSDMVAVSQDMAEVAKLSDLTDVVKTTTLAAQLSALPATDLSVIANALKPYLQD